MASIGSDKPLSDQNDIVYWRIYASHTLDMFKGFKRLLNNLRRTDDKKNR